MVNMKICHLVLDSHITLMDGGSYKGMVDKLKQPIGLGKEYFPKMSVEKPEIMRYEGDYLNGMKHGNGTLYFVDGRMRYKGEFVNGKPIKDISGDMLEDKTLHSTI